VQLPQPNFQTNKQTAMQLMQSKNIFSMCAMQLPQSIFIVNLSTLQLVQLIFHTSKSATQLLQQNTIKAQFLIKK